MLLGFVSINKTGFSKTIAYSIATLEKSLIIKSESIKSFICDSFKKNYSKIKIVTGKGHRSTIKENPYISSELGILKNSVPEFIKNDKDISDKIYKIYPADQTDGGDGAFYILLKKFKE